MSDRLTIEQRHNNMADRAYNQGVTLGEELLPLQGVWGARYLQYRCTDLAEPVEFLAAHFCYG